MNGYELIGRLRVQQKTRPIPIILHTSYDLKKEMPNTTLPSDIVIIQKQDGIDALTNAIKNCL